jgi:DNA-directed RNA polymerase subunit RPC12/RpoP
VTKIITYKNVRTAFEAEGYTLISKEYVNAKVKLDYICPKGHTHKITWTNFKSGYRCPYCAGRPPITIEQIRASFEYEGYTLLSEKYINAKSYLYFICPVGHRHKITWDAWRTGNRCGKCISVTHYGKTHPGWRGGVSRYKYCPIWNNKDYKESIKERDGYRCLNPYCSKENKVLTIHHIDYNKDNCGPDNLITVCSSCNSRANKDRKWHKAWYQAILKNRYNYRRI